jgi:hypothetical protein
MRIELPDPIIGRQERIGDDILGQSPIAEDRIGRAQGFIRGGDRPMMCGVGQHARGTIS